MRGYQEYIEGLVGNDNKIDDLLFNGFLGENNLSAIVKASIGIISELEQKDYSKIAIGFPNADSVEYEFILGWTVNAILNSEISQKYSIRKFQKGQHIKLKNVVCKYLGIEERESRIKGKNASYVVLQFCDGEKRFIPVDKTPIFQDTDAKKLSSSKSFDKARKDIKEEIDVITSIRTKRTHLTKSILFSSIENKNEMMQKIGETTINGQKIKNLVLLGKLTGNGVYSPMLSNTDKGIPALIVSSDLYGINNYLQEAGDSSLHSIVFRANKSAKMQYDPFKDIGFYDCTKIALFDSSDKDTIEFLDNQGYMIFNWNLQTITKDLFEDDHPISKQLKNHIRKRIYYAKLQSYTPVEEVIASLNNIRDEYFGDNELPDYHYELLSIALRLIRRITNTSISFEQELEMIRKELHEDQYYISQEVYDKYLSIISNILEVCTNEEPPLKKKWFYNRMVELENGSVCIVVPDNKTKIEVSNEYCSLKFKIQVNKRLMIHVMTATELLSSKKEFDLVIVIGWLNREQMKSIIYSCSIKDLEILLYEYEFDKWKQPSIKFWSRQVKRREYHNAYDVLFEGADDNSIGNFEEEPEIDDDILQIEKKLQLIKYSSFIKKGGNPNDFVNAYPVEFSNGTICFFREKHRLCVVTKIINGISNRVETRTPDLLEIDDYILIVESTKDVVKDLADNLIMKSELPTARSVSDIWKKGVSEYLKNYTFVDLLSALRTSGCKKHEATIKNWIFHNEDMISPGAEDLQMLLDIVCRNKNTQDKELIISASKLVRNAHQEAGKFLAQVLRKRFKDVYGENNSSIEEKCFELIVDEIGKAYVLNVMNPPLSKVQVDSSVLNRITEI